MSARGRRLVELLVAPVAGQIRGKLSCTVCRKCGLYATSFSGREIDAISRTRARHVSVPAAKPAAWEKSAATSTVPPLIIGPVSHKSTDRAGLSRNVAPFPCTSAAENSFTSRNCDSLAPRFSRGALPPSTPPILPLFHFARPLFADTQCRLVRCPSTLRGGFDVS